MKAEPTDVERASAAYTRRSLAFYDWWVLGVSNRFVWRCPTDRILELYQEHMSGNHLEVGVGTGYFLKNSLGETGTRIALLDINSDCLAHASKEISEHRPEIYHGNVLEPVRIEGAGFDSIAINYVLHCLPGKLEMKAEKVFDHLLPYLHDEGTVFGSTILGDDIQRPLLAKIFMGFYNKKGIFSNRNDSLGAIMETLSTRFRTFNVEVLGCVVLFWGKGVRNAYRETHPRQ